MTVFLRLARREGGSPLSDSLGGYLHRAAVNAGLDVIRSRQSRKTTALDDVERCYRHLLTSTPANEIVLPLFDAVVADARDRLLHLREHGPTATGWPLNHPVDPT